MKIHWEYSKRVVSLVMTGIAFGILSGCVLSADDSKDPSCGIVEADDNLCFDWDVKQECPKDGTIIMDNLRSANPKVDILRFTSAGTRTANTCCYAVVINKEDCGGGGFSLPPGF